MYYETSTIDGIDYQWLCLVSRMSNLSLIKAWGTSDGRIMRHWSYRPIVVRTLTEYDYYTIMALIYSTLTDAAMIAVYTGYLHNDCQCA